MKLTDVQIALPYLRWRIQVSHYAKRKPAVIEWLVMKVVSVTSANPKYSQVTVENLFSALFAVIDADKLIKPVIFSLRDMGLIEVKGLRDSTFLREFYMENFSLTDKGRNMLKEGFLPAMSREDVVEFTLNVVERNLQTAIEKSLKNSPEGMPLVSEEELAVISFPENEIRNRLEEMRREKNLVYPWLTNETEISLVKPLGITTLWKNVRRELSISKNMICSVRDVEDSAMAQAIVTRLISEMPTQVESLPKVVYENVEAQFQRCAPISEATEILRDLIRKENAFIIRKADFEDLSLGKFDKNNCKVILLCECDRFDIDCGSEGAFIVKIETKFLSDSQILQSETQELNRGQLTLDVYGQKKYFPAVYLLRSLSNDFAEKIFRIVAAYTAKDCRVLFLLFLLNLNEDFYSNLAAVVVKSATVAEKSATVNALNQLSEKYLHKKCIADSEAMKLLCDTESITRRTYNVDEMFQVINEYISAGLKDNVQLICKVISACILSLKDLSFVDEVWRIIEFIGGISASCLNWLSKEDALLRKLYSESVILDILRKMEDTELSAEKIPAKFLVERTFIDMTKILENIFSTLSDLEDFSDNGENIREALANADGNDISEVYQQLQRWSDVKDYFNRRIGGFEFYTQKSHYLRELDDFIVRLKRAVNIFYEERETDFRKFVVADTLALINRPEIIDKLAANKNYKLIIPTVVIHELYDYQNLDDDENAPKTDKVIRTLEKYKGADWLKLDVEGCAEVLPRGYDFENPANKILSSALKKKIRESNLITDDEKLFSDAKKIAGIRVLNSANFLSMIIHESKPVNGKKPKKKKRK